MQEITILGSTGSVGQSTLEVLSQLKDRFKVVGLSAYENIELLQEQIERFRPRWVAVAEDSKGETFRKNYKGALEEIFVGSEGLRELAGKKVDLLVEAIVGFAGLFPALESIKSGSNIALSNKEILVVAGQKVMEEARKHNVKIFPLDSEHCAIFQSIEKNRPEEVYKVILTASGGPFYNYGADEFASIKAKDALSHPVWKMGDKITIDSATLMNKGFEVIAAKWLFDLQWEQIKVVIHPQAIIHSLVEFVDGITLALLAHPDMKIPIQYVLTYPHRVKGMFEPVDLSEISKLTFAEPDENKFPPLKLAYDAGRTGGTMPAVLNASNEIAVESFLNDEITFPQIWEVARAVMNGHKPKMEHDLEDICEADVWAREETRTVINKL